MAEIALKIGQGSGAVPYEDGDVIEVYSDRRIACTYMQIFANPKKVLLTVYGLRETGSLGEFLLAKTREWKFERSGVEVVRTNLITLDQDTIGPTSNANREHIHVAEYLERQLEHPRHTIFGEPGSERWYGGSSDYSAAKVDAVWAEIESKSARRRVDYPLWPAGTSDLKHHFLISSDDFSESEEQTFAEPAFETVAVSEDYPQGLRMVMKRKRKVDWRANLGLSGKTQDDVLDRDLTVDKRDQFSYLKADIAEVKAMVIG